METQEKYITAVETELKSVMKMIETNFDKDYAKKNPDMVRHLMDKIQEHKYIDCRIQENGLDKNK